MKTEDSEILQTDWNESEPDLTQTEKLVYFYMRMKSYGMSRMQL